MGPDCEEIVLFRMFGGRYQVPMRQRVQGVSTEAKNIPPRKVECDVDEPPKKP